MLFCVQRFNGDSVLPDRMGSLFVHILASGLIIRAEALYPHLSPSIFFEKATKSATTIGLLKVEALRFDFSQPQPFLKKQRVWHRTQGY